MIVHPLESNEKAELKEIADLLHIPDSWSNEELIKLTRRIEFAKNEDSKSGGQSTQLKSLVSATQAMLENKKKNIIPKRRFGKTNLNVSILTCGGMRLQETWCPDNIPVLGSRSPLFGFGMSGISSDCQNNLIAIIRRALHLGINHFETARMYGTSEMQFAAALKSMIDSGEISRNDFILQTKILPTATLKDFISSWTQSWSLFKILGHVDLLSLHGVNFEKHYKWVFDNGKDSLLPFLQSLIAEGKAHHLGFSTHGLPKLVAKVIKSNVFSYVNIHAHGVFGDYHGSGCSDDNGSGFGHRANVALAKSLDMGVFIISPFDKGGKLYQPSSLLMSFFAGSDLTPLEYQACYQWSKAGDADTIVIGASKPSDFDEVAAIFVRGLMDSQSQQVEEITTALWARIDEVCGEGGLAELYRGLPDLTDSSANGIAVAHMVWLWVLLKAFGLYEYCLERFANLESATKGWKSDKTVEENINAWTFNPGRAPKNVRELEEEGLPAAALAQCPNPDRIRQILRECYSLLAVDGDANPTLVQQQASGWSAAYSLRTWADFPGSTNVSSVIVNRLSLGLVGGGGPKKDANYLKEAKTTRAFWKDIVTGKLRNKK